MSSAEPKRQVAAAVRQPPVIGIGFFSFEFGGSERVGADLAYEFAERGYRVVCFAFHSSDGPIRRELERAGIRCLDMSYHRIRGMARRLEYWWRFWRMLREERIDALHVHHFGALILAGPPARVAGIRRMVMTEHGLQALMQKASHRGVVRRYARFATDITAVEPGQVDYFHRVLGQPLRKLHCVPNGIRLRPHTAGDVGAARSMLGIPPEAFVFICVARLNAVKDLGTLLRAFAALPVSDPERYRLVIVGDGPERGPLEAMRADLGIEQRVMMLGARDDVVRLLPAADAFVMSSLSEGLPVALLEAMASGLPCVATAVGGIPGLLDAGAGVTVPPGAPQSLAAAMAGVSADADKRRMLGQQAARVVHERYAVEPVVDRYLELMGLAVRAVPVQTP